MWMQHAIHLAKTAEENGEVPIGAVLIVNNEIIGEGWNQPIKNSDPTAHAEIIALRAAAKHLNNYRLLDSTLYVTLEPCIMCVGAIIQARVKHVVFGAYDKRFGATNHTHTVNHQVVYEGGVMAEECGNLLSEFFRKKR
jgi:tRNA(adenine34) deaminase